MVSRSNSIFTEHVHVAYQIKENHECSNIVANILHANPLPPPPPSERRIRNAATYSQIFFPEDPPIPGTESVGQNTSLLENGHVAYQIIENQQ